MLFEEKLFKYKYSCEKQLSQKYVLIYFKKVDKKKK